MSETPENTDTAGGHRRACDQCRARKVRCDKGPGPAPCSSCRAGQRECKTTGLGQKAKDVKHRVLISQQYEHKIDQFEARLAGIERMLQQLTASLSKQGSIADKGADGVSRRATNTSSGSLSAANTDFERQRQQQQQQQQPQSNAGAADGRSDPPVTGDNDNDSDNEDEDDSDALEEGGGSFEGGSSMAAHTAFASDFLEQAVTSAPLGRAAQPDMQSALAALRAIVDRQKQQQQQGKEGQWQRTGGRSALPHQKAVPRGGVCQLPLPPADVVLKLLREIRSNPPMTFMMSCAFLAVDDFVDACRRVYFATEDPGVARFIIVNAGLYYLFEEKVAAAEAEGVSSLTSADRGALVAHQRLCRANLETALAHLPLLQLPPSPEMVEALLLGATYAVERARFSLAWQLNSAAAAMCQTLGWHHHHAGGGGTGGASQKGAGSGGSSGGGGGSTLRPATFWFCYMLDKGLALRFGRSAALPDWDVSTPRSFRGDRDRVNENGGDDGDAWAAVMDVWIRTGSVLGQAYERLYSPGALARPAGERATAARQLVAQAQQLWWQFEGAAGGMGVDVKSSSSVGVASASASASEDRKDAWRAATRERVLRSGEVGHLATLTLLYRAMPSSSSSGSSSSFLSAECVAAARGAFRSHAACLAQAGEDLPAQAGHVHWTVLYAPFAPLVVLFCHVVEVAGGRRRKDTDGGVEDEMKHDLGLLDEFAVGLRPLCRRSPAITRLHRLSRLLHQIAALYVRAKNATLQEEDKGLLRGEQRPAPQGQRHRHRRISVPVDADTDTDMEMDMHAVGNDIDRYLSQLGFLPHPNPMPATAFATEGFQAPLPPSSASILHQQQQQEAESIMLDAGDMLVTDINAVTGAGAGVTAPGSSQATADPATTPLTPQLEDWFSGNTYVMGLIEDDLLDFGWDPAAAEPNRY